MSVLIHDIQREAAPTVREISHSSPTSRLRKIRLMVMSIIKVASLLWLRSAAAGKLEPWWSWTWDRVPRWASGQGATDFSLNTTRYYTTNFDIMWTQGTTCCWSGSERAGYHTWEDGVISDVAKVRRCLVVMVVLVMDAWWW